MIIYSNCQRPFGFILSDYIFIQMSLNLARCRTSKHEFCIFPHFLVFQVFQYFIRCLNAFVTNHPMFTSDKMVYLICFFPTHKTVFLSSHIPSPLIVGRQNRRPCWSIYDTLPFLSLVLIISAHMSLVRFLYSFTIPSA